MLKNAAVKGAAASVVFAARRKSASVARAFSAAWAWVVAVPGDVYAKIYCYLRLNRAYHRARIPATVQVGLIPRRLPVTRRLMQQPYWVPVKAIRWGGRPAGGAQRLGKGYGCGVVFDGDWDIEDKQDIEQYLSRYIYSKTVFQLFRDGIPYDQTDQFHQIARCVRAGYLRAWQARGCRTPRDIQRYFDGLRNTFEEMRRGGYKTQEQLGSPRWYDEIKVFIDRNGEFHKQQGAGHHRLAMAKLLGIEEVPVLVVGIHRSWALSVQARIGEDVLTSVDLQLRQLSTRPAGYPKTAKYAAKTSI